MARKHAACGSQPCPKHLQCCTAALNMPKNHPKPLLRQGKAANLGQDDEPGHAVSCSHAPTLVIQVHGSSLGAACGGLNVSSGLWKEETAAAISPPSWYSPSKYLPKNPPGASQLLCTEAHTRPQAPCSSLQPQPLLLLHSLMLGTKQGHPQDTAPSQGALI